jgi:alpha-N-arabinofuranosidase
VHDIPEESQFFDKISTQIPTEWQPETVDAIVTSSADGRRIVIKAVNYRPERNVLLVRLKGERVPERATVMRHSITADPSAKASMEHPDALQTVSRAMEYSKNLSLELEPYTVAVLEMRAE